MKTALAILILLFSFQSKAAGVCDDKQSLLNLWQTKYGPTVQFHNVAGFDSSLASYKLAKAFCLLENPGVLTYNFFSYIFKYFSKPSIKPEISTDSYASSKNGDLEIFAPYFIDTKGMEYTRASVLIHEARHLDLKKKKIEHKHVVCTHGESEGLVGCDRSFTPNWDSGSPISFEVMFLRGLYEDSNPKYNKPEILRLIKLLLNNYFNDNVDSQIYESFTSEKSTFTNQISTL